MYSSNNFNKMFKMLISPLVMNLTKEGLAIVGQSIIPPILSLEHLGHEPDQGGAGHSGSLKFSRSLVMNPDQGGAGHSQSDLV